MHRHHGEAVQVPRAVHELIEERNQACITVAIDEVAQSVATLVTEKYKFPFSVVERMVEKGMTEIVNPRILTH
jgi:hypothetical protein